MHTVSRDFHCYYLTSVPKDRLPVFRTDEIKLVTCAAMDEARLSGGFGLYAYVIMPDHLHVITDSTLSPSRNLQFINGIVSRRVIDYLKLHNYETSLKKLRNEIGPRLQTFFVGPPSRRTFVVDRKDVDAKSSLHSSESGPSQFGGAT